MSKAPPQLHFDDGSRIIHENASSKQPESDLDAVKESAAAIEKFNPRGTSPINIYYEISRIASEIVNQLDLENENKDGFLCKVALQLPDELLDDAAELCWLIEDAIIDANKLKVDQNGNGPQNEFPPLVFVLGDTTYSSCCPDEIGALHLSADVIVHFGQYACLSPSQCLPVIYSFGITEWNGMEKCIRTVSQHLDDQDTDTKNILLLCERRYHQYMGDLSRALRKSNKIQEVVIGSVPSSNFIKKTNPSKSSSCCAGVNTNESACCGRQGEKELSQCSNNDENCSLDNDDVSHIIRDDELYIGGLQVSIDPLFLQQYTLLYIGDDSGQSKSRQFLNTILQCSSPTNGTNRCWSYNTVSEKLSTDPFSTLGVSRYLNRRFYLTQKAQLASIIGILVGTLSQDRFRSVIASVRQKIQDSGRGCYTFVVGKINVAKLANFAEVECFVLISCGETSVIKDEREFHVPIITPSELEIVLGDKEWVGGDSCNTSFTEFLKDENDMLEIKKDVECGRSGGSEEEGEDTDDDDEPFFSMISGTYMSKPMTQDRKKKQNNINRTAESQLGSELVEYKSEAAEFWKKREYKGLEAKIGQTEATAAVEGQTGIASDYGK